MIPRELRFALRSLLQARGFTFGVVAVLALGLTLCTTAMVVVKAYLLSGMPYPAAERLYWIRYAAPGQQGPRDMELLDWASLDDVLEQQVAWDLDMFYLLGGQGAESAPGAWVTPGFVRGLGIAPAFGPGFDDADFRPGGPNPVLISHRLWVNRFGRDPGVVGRRFNAYVSDRPNEAESFTVAGVLPEGFWHINPYTDILAPLRAPTFPYLARLRPGVRPADAAARISTLVRAGGATPPDGWSVTLESVHDAHVAQLRPTLRAVSIASALVLLVACANAAGLLLVRSTRRQREIAVRAALGAGRGALARMLLTEGLLLATTASVVALALTYGVIEWLAPVAQQQLGQNAPGGVSAFSIDVTVLAFAAAAGACTAVICSLVPLAVTLRPALLGALGSSRTATEGPRSRRLRSALIALEIAASLTLLAGSALMLRSVGRMVDVDLGFDAAHVLNASLTLRQNRYPDAASRAAAFERMTAALASMPAVRAAALTNAWPVQQPGLVPVERSDAGASAGAALHGVTASYFETLSIPLVAGRSFTAADRSGSEAVAIISASLARTLWPDGSAVGASLVVPQGRDGGEPLPVTRRIVGIARDVRQGPADDETADVYVPMLQAPTRFAFALVRTHGEPAASLPAVRETFRTIDPELSLDRARDMQGLVDALTARPRFLASLLGSLAAVAALLALVGVYGVIAYAVRQREREIAVRLAVGASPRQVVGLFVRQGTTIILTGLALGVLLTLATTRVIASELFGVSARDPLALATAVLAFGLAGLFAVWSPARRAAQTDPAAALRTD